MPASANRTRCGHWTASLLVGTTLAVHAAAGGLDPDRDVTFTVVLPAETVDALMAGKIDGFCAGAPWGKSPAAPE